MQIWHNGSNSYITQYSDVGDLYLNCHNDDNDVIIQTDNGSGSTADYFRADGSTGEAILYHYGTQKLATKSTGIDVTGVVTATGFSTTTGTSSQFLKADGSVDSSTYLTSLGTAIVDGDFTSNGFMKRTGAGTYTVDTNTYLTSAAAEAFKTIAVSGQSDVIADLAADTLTLAAGSNMTITTDANTDTITFASSGGGGGSSALSTLAFLNS